MLKTAYLQFRTALTEHVKRVRRLDPEALPREPDNIVLYLDVQYPDAQYDEVKIQWDEYVMGNYMGCHKLSVPLYEILAEDPEAALIERLQAKEAAKASKKKADAAAERDVAKQRLTEILSKYPDLKGTIG